MAEVDNPSSHLIVTVHGIQTFGQWQERLEQLVCGNPPTQDVEFINYKYGVFSIVGFVIPIFRWLVVRQFRRELIRLCSRRAWSRIDLVGHSFGTHIIGWSIAGLPREDETRFHTIILAGSVLKAGFAWRDLIGFRVKRVINDCGTKDSVLLLSQFFVLFTGMAGRIGFSGSTSAEFRNRYSEFGHSGYFQNNLKQPYDAYMQRWWVPVLSEDARIAEFDSRVPKRFDAILSILANNAEPIKLTVYVAPLVAAVLWVSGLYLTADRERRIAEEQRNNALTTQSRYLADASRQNLASDPVTAALIAIEALPNKTEGVERPLVREAQQRLFDALEMQNEAALFSRAGPDSLVRWLGDGTKVLIVSKDSSLAIWDFSNGGRSLLQSEPGQATKFAINQSRDRIVAVASGGVARIWDREGARIAEIPDVAEDSSILISGDGRRLALTRKSHMGEIWDLATGIRLVSLEGGSIQIGNMAFNQDGSLIAALDAEGHASLWNAQDGKKISSLSYTSANAEPPIVVNATRQILVRGEEGFAVWDGRTKIMKLDRALFGPIVGVSDDGSRFIVQETTHASRAHYAGSYFLFNAINLHQISTLHEFDEGPATWTSDLGDVQFAPVQKRIVASLDQSEVALYDWDGKQIKQYRGRKPMLSSNKKWMASVSPDNRIEIRRVDDGELAFSVPTGEASIERFDVDENAEHIFTAGADGTVRMWSRFNLKTRSTFDTTQFFESDRDDFPGPLTGMKISPDGRYLATASPPRYSMPPAYMRDGVVRIWDLDSGERLAFRARSPRLDDSEDDVVTPTFSANGNWVRIETAHDPVIFWNWREKPSEPFSETEQPAIDSEISRAGDFPPAPRTNWKVEVQDGGISAVDGRGFRYYFGTWKPTDNINLIDVSSKADRLVVADTGGEVRVFTVFEDHEALLIAAKSKMTRCMTPGQRKRLFLGRIPPRWCITGVGREQSPPAAWMGLWPYEAPRFKAWLSDADAAKRSGLKPSDFPQ